MTKKERFNDIINGSRLNSCKEDMNVVANRLEEAGLTDDAEKLMKIVYKLEAFQNKYGY